MSDLRGRICQSLTNSGKDGWDRPSPFVVCHGSEMHGCLTGSKNHRGEWAPNPGTDRTGSEFPAKCAGNPCQSCQSRGRSWVAMKSAWQFFMSFRGPKAHPNRVEKPPRGVGSEPGDRQDWHRISGKMRRKSMPVLSVPGARVGGDEVTMAVFHEVSRAEGPSQPSHVDD